jgi:hypothetical protein
MTIDIAHIDLLLEQRFEALTEEQIQYLIENRIEYIKNALKDKISTAHDPESAGKSSDQIIDHIAKKIDPTIAKTHTQWLTNRYRTGEFKLSDAKAVKKTMESYETNKPLMAQKDLNALNSLTTLRDHIATTTLKQRFNDARSKEKGEAEINMPVVHTTEHQQGTIKTYQVPNKSVAIKNYGPAGKLAQCSWCTSASGNKNMFTGYAGGKYTMHFPNGAILQYHHKSGQLMDEKNQPINLDHNERYKPYSRQIAESISHTREIERGGEGDGDSLVSKHFYSPPERLDQLFEVHGNALKKYNEATVSRPYNHSAERDDVRNSFDAIVTHVNNGEIADEHFDRLANVENVLRFSGGTEQNDLRYNIPLSKYAKPEHLDRLADVIATKYSDRSDHSAKDTTSRIITNKNVTGDTLHKIIGMHISNPDRYEKTGLLRYVLNQAHGLTMDHINRIKPHVENAEEESVKNDHAILPEHVLIEAAKKSDLVGKVATRHDITPEVAKSILDDSTIKNEHHASIFRNPSVPLDVVEHGLKTLKSPASTFNGVADRADTTPQHMSMLVDRMVGDDGVEPDNTMSMLTSPKINRESLRKLMDSPKYTSRIGTILNNPRIKADDISHALTKVEPSQLYGVVVDHPAVKSQHIDTLVDDVKDTYMLNRMVQKIAERESENDAITPQHISKLLNNSNVSISNKHRLLHHAANIPEHFQSVADNARFHGAISTSPNATPSVLHTLATSPLDHVRLNVAKNANTEGRTLEMLKTDHNEQVAAVATKRAK